MIASELALSLADEFGTPLYAYDLDDVDKRSGELRRLLPEGAHLFYSLKANPLPAIAVAARRAGCRAEVSSAGELSVALTAGFDAAEMLVTGPAKGDADLRHAVARGVGWFSAESLQDLERIAAAARRADATVQVLLRVNPPSAPNGALAMGGSASQFGFDEAALRAARPFIAQLEGIEVAGVHNYFGSQLPSPDALAASFEVGIAAAEALPWIEHSVLDLGGGFPWPFTQPGGAPDLAPLTLALASLDMSRAVTAGAELWFESGRYLVASSGTLVARVMDVKVAHGRSFVVLDAGIAQLGGMTGLGRILPPAATFVALDGAGHRGTIRADVVGPLCTPLDFLARGALVPDLEPGELVAVPNVGAYGATASLVSFLSHPAAVEVSLRDGRVVDAARLRGGHESLATVQKGGFADATAVRGSLA